MENNDLISIIIPCYNDWQYVEQAVYSALNQTYQNKEVIIVDDGSNAKTKEILKRLEPKITKLITQENQGQSKARNVGIKASKGGYILVLDSDDFFEPSFSEKAIQVFINKKSVKLVTCQANLLFEDGSSRIFTPKGGDISDFILSNNALGTSLFRKEDWQSSGGYDESMRNGFEDWEFFIRLLEMEGIAEVIQEPLYNYRKQNISTTTIANSKKYELLKYIYLKHEELYKNNFESFVFYMLSRIEREEKEKIKNTLRLEFQIGKAILRPVRFIKSLFR
jgi:glycosyltransferase involved in cell wall biosynthesis